MLHLLSTLGCFGQPFRFGHQHHSVLRVLSKSLTLARRFNMNKGQGRLRPRRFAPLDPSKKSMEDKDAPSLNGIIFDVDGTLCMSSKYKPRYFVCGYSQLSYLKSTKQGHCISTHTATDYTRREGEPQNYMFAEMR